MRAPCRTDYVVTSPGLGPNGGKRYDISVRIGSQIPAGRFNDPTYYLEPIIPQGSQLAGLETINQLKVSYGVGSGGVAFDEVTNPSQVIITSAGSSIQLSGDGLPPNFTVSSVVAGNPISAFVNADGTVGFEVTYDADDITNSAIKDFFAGDWATRNVMGFGQTIIIEVVPEPASLAMVSMAAIGGLLFVRRRRA